MKTYGNQITIHRGESFTIDKYIVNKDGSPYIISNALKNPHLRISVSDSLYEQNGRYILNTYLDLSKLPRFVNTNVVDITLFRDRPNGAQLYPTFDGMTGLPSGYIGDSLVTYEKGNEAVFCNRLSDGKMLYKYFSNGSWRDYSFRLIKSFSNELTRNWNGQNYWYDIALVSGPMINGTFARFDTKLSILNPTKLTVLSDLEGGQYGYL